MSIETERRFLVKNKEWQVLIKKCIKIRQGYLSTDFQEWITRIRIINNQRSYITIKNSKGGMQSHEFEYKIPIHDAESIWHLLNYKLIKQRYLLDLNPGSWVVDCFKNENSPLVIAEVELEAPELDVMIPDWCGKELTGQKQWSNAALAKFPLSKWPQEDRKKLADL
ncbi:CYTH domain-containing protein [Prochlorococcus marinus]|uniref:Adenylate cyclase n=1 Tax=Prochlorococcus marinus (strain MIT 9211) TaxID=93059 RepID=A9BD15_PROM4|nr:CYTH domain-containing protein [Prochlorococcus marinus]ABX08103.1 adenylate cyclase [Prochlorococcus marinus str. MIT 9211]